MKHKIVISFIVLLISSYTPINAQSVGINTDDPNRLTELDIKNLIDGTDTIPKGIMIPRMTTMQRDAIDVSDPFLANSLLIYNTDDDCYNYYSRIEGEWQNLCGKVSKAQFTISNCDSVKVSGTYANNTAFTANSYLTIPVTVTKKGTYTITAIPNPDNGYYFTTSGEFLTTGTFNIIVPGVGTPKQFTPKGESGDNVIIYLNGTESNCSKFIVIEDSSLKPEFSLDCRTASVTGNYIINKSLDATNTITMVLKVNPAIFGARYTISTNEVDGISFSGSGELQESNQTVTLYGSGRPTSTGKKTFTITSNSISSSLSCETSLNVTLKSMVILTKGTTSPYGYNVGIPYAGATGIYRYGGNKVSTTSANFGSANDSKVLAQPVIFKDKGVTAGTLANDLNLEKPDIVIIGYAFNLNASDISALGNYLRNSGVVLMFSESPAPTANFMTNIFETTITGNSIASSGAIYTFENNLTDPVLNGPFGSLSGEFWGEDASATAALNNVPLSEITLYSNGVFDNASGNPAQVTAFRHNKYNLIFVGDGGFNSTPQGAGDVTSHVVCPFYIDAAYKPIKGTYGDVRTVEVSNSIFFSNALAWAMKKAQYYGINSPY